MKIRILHTLSFFFLFSCAVNDATENQNPGGDSGVGGDAGPSSGDADVTGDGGFKVTSGTRIRVQYLVAEDGPTLIDGLFDNELGVPCSFQQASDGVLRCLPTTPANNRHYNRALETWFPVLQGNMGCAPTFITTTATIDSCDGPKTSVHRITGFLDEICAVFSDPYCFPQRIPSQGPDGATFHVASEELPPEVFVEATSSEHGEGRLRTKVLETADGLQFPQGIIDTDTGRPCSFQVAADGEHRCLPSVINHGYAFIAETSQWVPYAEGNTQCAPQDLRASESVSAFSCELASDDVFEIERSVQQVCIQTRDGSCSSYRLLDGDDGRAFFLAGGALGADQFVSAELEIADPQLRLRRKQVVTADGFASSIGLHDDELGTSCSFITLSDTTERCLPDAYATGKSFRDGLWSSYRSGNESCRPDSITQIDNASIYSCEPSGATVYNVGERLTQICTQTTNGDCTVFQTLNQDAEEGAAFLSAGAEVSVTQYVRGIRVRD